MKELFVRNVPPKAHRPIRRCAFVFAIKRRTIKSARHIHKVTIIPREILIAENTCRSCRRTQSAYTTKAFILHRIRQVILRISEEACHRIPIVFCCCLTRFCTNNALPIELSPRMCVRKHHISIIGNACRIVDIIPPTTVKHVGICRQIIVIIGVSEACWRHISIITTKVITH